MNTRVDVVFRVKPLDDLTTAIERYEDSLQRVVRLVYQRLQPALLSLLRTYPPVPPTSRYRRTFRLKNNWLIELRDIGSGIEITISNRTSYASFVVGGLTGDFNSAQRFQRDFHGANGWQIAQKTIDDWFVEFVQQVKIELATLGLEGTRL